MLPPPPLPPPWNTAELRTLNQSWHAAAHTYHALWFLSPSQWIPGASRSADRALAGARVPRHTFLHGSFSTRVSVRTYTHARVNQLALHNTLTRTPHRGLTTRSSASCSAPTTSGRRRTSRP